MRAGGISFPSCGAFGDRIKFGRALNAVMWGLMFRLALAKIQVAPHTGNVCEWALCNVDAKGDMIRGR